jgi:hypothetical protein
MRVPSQPETSMYWPIRSLASAGVRCGRCWQIDVPSAPRTGWRPGSYPSDPIVGTTSRGKGPKPARRPGTLAEGLRCDPPADHGPRLVTNPEGVRPLRRRRRRRRGRSANSAGQVTLSGYLPWTHSPPAWRPIRWSTGTTRGPARMGCAARKAPSRRARSGTSRRSPAPGAGRGAAGVREDAHLRQPPGPVCRADQPHRTAARELPQALTHLALISAAFNLDRALGA